MIREAGDTDLPWMREVLFECLKTYQTWEGSNRHLASKRWLNGNLPIYLEEGHFLVIKEKAFVAWKPVGGGQAHVTHLFVLPTAWRTGLGRKMLGAAEGKIKAAALREAYLWVAERNKGAREFYLANGWLPSQERTAHDRLHFPMVRYEKQMF